MSPKHDHSAGVAAIAATLNAALDGSPLDANALAFACAATGIDFALAVQAMHGAKLISFKKNEMYLGPLGYALLVSAYIDGG